MSTLANLITAELQVLVGKRMSGCWRAANMQMFGFGAKKTSVNRIGKEVEKSELALHVQCRWRIIEAGRILFGSDDLFRPADENMAFEDFDWDQDDSVLDVVQRAWFKEHGALPLRAVHATGDTVGGFKITLEKDVVLEAFPCNSNRDEYSEHWRLLDHSSDGSHFVITGYGVESETAIHSTGNK